MTTPLADLLAGEDMEGGEGFCDSVYNFLKNQGKDINLFTNSGFGVWSQSDASKGLATITYDSGSVAPVVGEALTGATSGATCKVISYTLTGGTWGGTNAAGVLTVGACSHDFAWVDNEDVNGSVGGANMLTVNMPDAAVQVGLIQNGGFAAATTGWTTDNCTLASIGGGQVGNCLEITRTAGGNQTAGTSIATTVGKIYKVSVYVKSGTSGNEAFRITVGQSGVGDTAIYSGITTPAWVLHTLTAEADANSVEVQLTKDSGTAGTMLFDEATCYEITPCCTVADNLAFDGWYKDATCDIYRQHWDSTYSKCGSFYSLKIVPTVADDYVRFPGAIYDNEEWYKQFCGQPVTVGAWVYASVASHAKLVIQQTSGDTSSTYHSGTPGWEWLEITEEIAANTAFFDIQLFCDAAPNVDGSTIVYISQPMLVFGWSLGEGMYQPRLQEWIWLDLKINSTLIADGYSDVAAVILNLEADSDGIIPKGIKGIEMVGQVADSGSAAQPFESRLELARDVAMDLVVHISAAGLANDTRAANSGIIGCDANGDIYYKIRASGANTLDIKGLHSIAVQVN